MLRIINSVICVMVWQLIVSGSAFAHGTEKHGKTSMDDPQMKKLHAMMPMFSQEAAKLERALEKGDAARVRTHCGNILQAIPELKKCRPHKHIKERQKFVELATDLEKSVTATANMAQTGDFAAGIASFKKLEESCSSCHAKFRD